MLLTHRGALALTSRDRWGWSLQRVKLVLHGEAIWAFNALDLMLAASQALPNNTLDLSEVVVTSLPAQNDALALASRLRIAQ